MAVIYSFHCNTIHTVQYNSTTLSPQQVVIAGNHDLTFDVENYPAMYRRFGHHKQFDCHKIRDIIITAPRVTYLEDAETVINGIRIWGSPW